jgi:CSLREA domain-containing protein
MVMTNVAKMLLTSALLLLIAAACDGGGDGGFTIVVDSTADTDARDDGLTLREAILVATGELAAADLAAAESDNVHGKPGAESADVIGFDPKVFPPAQPASIALTATLPSLTTGNDAIDGAGAGVVIDSGKQEFNCLIIESAENAIRGLQMQNCLTAILLMESASANVIGGPEASQRNVISDNSVAIEIDGTANVVQGNYLGTDPTGTASRPNAMEGIWIGPGGRDNIIGGSKPGEGNLISGNALYGLNIGGANATGNVVKGNLIGVDVSGEKKLQNRYGLVLSVGAQRNTIGGTEPGDANIISGNQSGGMLIRGSDTADNVIIGNMIGTDRTGEMKLGNGTAIWLLEGAHGHVIGGIEEGEANVIAFSGIIGVQVEGADTTGNTIRGNSLHSNAREGILSVEGGNAGLAPPEVTAANPVSGTACPNCTVDIYSDAADEGRVYEGSTTADAGGSFTFDEKTSGPFVTATATDAEGNTSAFSESRAAPAR